MNEEGPDLHFPGQGIEVTCPCGHLWRVPPSLRGGLVNCPSCRKVVTVPRGGRPEVLFWLILAGSVLPFVAAAALLFVLGAVTAGWIVLGVGALVVTVALAVM